MRPKYKSTLYVFSFILFLGFIAGCNSKNSDANQRQVPQKQVQTIPNPSANQQNPVSPVRDSSDEQEGVLIQQSSGNCSPNIVTVEGKAEVNCPGDKGNGQVVKRRGHGVVIQKSTGDNSPNISGVNGPVVINIGGDDSKKKKNK